MIEGPVRTRNHIPPLRCKFLKLKKNLISTEVQRNLKLTVEII
jgi:hypothetical protein